MALAKIDKKDGKLYITAPYNQSFIGQIKAQGGKWEPNKKVWVTEEGKEEAIKAIIRSVYGIDLDNNKTIDIEYKAIDFWPDRQDVKVGGIVTATRRGRNSGVLYLASTYVKSGTEPNPLGGGSAKHPSVDPEVDTVFVSTIPESVYNGLSDEDKAKIKVLDGQVSLEGLLKEKAELLKKLDELNKKIEKMGRK